MLLLLKVTTVTTQCQESPLYYQGDEFRDIEVCEVCSMHGRCEV